MQGVALESFFDTLKNLGAARLGIMLLTLFGLMIFFIFILVRTNAPSMTMLYGDLSTADSTKIAAKLDISNIAYRIDPNSNQIMVGHKDVGRARMLLAEEGLPSGGTLGYEIFDKKQRFGTTSFVQNINQLRALEGELARTIGTLEQIRTARVHLVLPQREMFSRESQPASASVFISLRSSNLLNNEQVLSIQHLVASAVPQLKPNNISIIDGNGTLLAKGGAEESSTSMSANTSEDLKRKYEQRLTRSIEDLVSRIVGYGKIRAQVTADLDFNIISRNSEIYDPEGQVVRSTQTITQADLDAAGGTDKAVSVQNNLPGLPGASGSSGGALGASSNREEEIVNFEITKTIESLVQESGEVQKLSIAVLIDGKYKDVPSPDDENETIKEYVPRSQEELDQISTLVKSAIGFDEIRGDQIEVVNMQFAEIETLQELPSEDLIFGFNKSDVLGMAETATLSVVAVLIILLVLRPLVSHAVSVSSANAKLASQRIAAEEAALLETQMATTQLAAPNMSLPGMAESAGGELEDSIDMAQVEGKVKSSSIQKISELVDNHPNETVSVIRSWMSQEG